MVRYPYNLKEHEIVLDPSSIWAAEAGTLAEAAMVKEVMSWEPEEQARVLLSWSLLVEKCAQRWIDAVKGRTPEEFSVMALDTAMVWERG